jgi:hypothetical protein
VAKVNPKEPVSRGVLNDAVDTILKGVDNLLTNRDKHYNKRFDKVDFGLKKLGVGQKGLKNEMNGLKAEFSDTPSRKEFGKLKARVDKYRPLVD